MDFKVLGDLHGAETFAVGREIRELKRLRKLYGPGRWRKRKGIARVCLADGTIREAEVHWYEASGIGRKELRVFADCAAKTWPYGQSSPAQSAKRNMGAEPNTEEASRAVVTPWAAV